MFWGEKRGTASGAAGQAAALRLEGVRIDQGNMGEFMVDFATYGWFPDVLPSEEVEGDGG